MLAGRVAVVSGAAQGLGEAFASALATAGCRVALLDTRRDELEKTVQAMQAGGVDCRAWTVDIRDAAACEAAMGEVLQTFGPVDILVNNAGVSTRAQLEDAEFSDEIDRM